MIRTDLIRTISDVLDHQAAERPTTAALVDDRRTITYEQLEARTGALAGGLRDLAGVERGDRGMIVMGNRVEVAESYLALVRAGLVAVCVNPAAAAPEIAYQLDHSEAKVVLTDDLLRPVVEALLAEPGRDHVHVVVAGEAFEALALAANVPAPADDLALDETAFLLYTSGTTGRPKGVMLTQHSLLWVVASCWAPMFGLGPGDVLLSPLPLFHSYALDLCVLAVVATGATVRIMDRFSTPGVLEHLGDPNLTPTLFCGVPTMFQYLVAGTEGADGLAVPDVSSLRRAVSAGAILPASVNDAFEGRFGVQLLDGYGITETSTMVIMNWPDAPRVPGSCGIQIPGVDIRLVDPATGRDVGVDTDGEIWISGPLVMQGYLRNPEATAEVLTDGWYHSGDLGRRDRNGFVTISGRTKELIIRGGENIYPAEVEAAVMRAQGVCDAAVASASHDALGEVPVAFIVLDEPGSLPADVLAERVRKAVAAELTAFKVPEQVIEVEEIPRTGSGKTMRYKLQQLL